MRTWEIYLEENGERSMALSPVPGTTAVVVVALDDVVEALRNERSREASEHEWKRVADFIERRLVDMEP